jgi:hypothetical protein
LGLATSGHAHAVEGTGLAPIFAQQSVRENIRTQRTPQQVLDEAMWGVLQSGWREPWGADADHLKTPADIDAFHEAGFTFFTIDPGEHVQNEAQDASLAALQKQAHSFSWDQMHSSLDDLRQRYLGGGFQVENYTFAYTEDSLLRALVKYGQAIIHAAQMEQHLRARPGGGGCDLEISVDETETPTSPEEHFFIASELRRSGVLWTSLAPRFIGRFEKGTDYIGDLAAFETEFARHAAIARHFGNYRLSLHTGSDKFSIYPIAARQTRGLLHLKTAGTSYLEALRLVARANPALFQKIYHLAVDRYEEERASYHVSADLSVMPAPGSVADHDLPALLDQFDTRQVLHVTFGSVVDRFGPLLVDTLRSNENEYDVLLAEHFHKHFAPLVSWNKTT